MLNLITEKNCSSQSSNISTAVNKNGDLYIVTFILCHGLLIAVDLCKSTEILIRIAFAENHPTSWSVQEAYK